MDKWCAFNISAGFVFLFLGAGLENTSLSIFGLGFWILAAHLL